jgi:hypothetical protein
VAREVAVVIDPALLADWVPCRGYWRGSEAWIDWCYLGEERFNDPFFEETLARCLREPFRMLFRHQTPIEVLSELAVIQPGLPPAGFIFHLSRCGSTLISQLLAASDRRLVISEAGPLDFVVRATRADGSPLGQERLDWVRGMMSALGRARHPGQAQFFVKLDSWHTLLLPLILGAFPEVPWIFLYRDPVEVMVSHRRRRGIQMVPGGIDPEFVGIDPAALPTVSLDGYMERVLEGICAAALLHRARGRGLLINYSQLPEAFTTLIASQFNVAFHGDEMGRLAEVWSRDAKAPLFQFRRDTDDKQNEAPADLRTLAAERLVPLYQQLEAARASQTDHASRSQRSIAG